MNGTQTTRFERPLTEDEMTEIHDAIMDAVPSDRTLAGVVAFYDVALRDEGLSLAEVDEVDPKQFAIPEGQWARIVGWMMEGTGLLTAGFDWMNRGPSAYKVGKAHGDQILAMVADAPKQKVREAWAYVVEFGALRCPPGWPRETWVLAVEEDGRFGERFVEACRRATEQP